MRLPRPFCPALCAPALLALAASALQAQSFTLQPGRAERTTASHTALLADRSSLSIKNTRGHIKVEAWDRPEVGFSGTFRPGGGGAQVKVAFEPVGSGLEIRGEYPPSEPGQEAGAGASCDMDLKVPRGVQLRVETVDGRIVLSGLEGGVECRAVNGAIEAADLSHGLTARTENGVLSLIRVRGAIRGATVNGVVYAKGLDGEGMGIDLSTVNGAVSVSLAKREGTLQASAEHGELSVDTKGATQVKATRHQVEATFPGRDQRIRVSTANGALILK